MEPLALRTHLVCSVPLSSASVLLSSVMLCYAPFCSDILCSVLICYVLFCMLCLFRFCSVMFCLGNFVLDLISPWISSREIDDIGYVMSSANSESKCKNLGFFQKERK